VFRHAAEELKDEIIFVKSGVTEGISRRLANVVGVTPETSPSIYIMQGKKPQTLKYRLKIGNIDRVTVDDIRDFISDFKEDKLERFLKSGPIPSPAKERTTYVKSINAQMWENVVEDPLLDVLVLFT
jgi:hypothetical protein